MTAYHTNLRAFHMHAADFSSERFRIWTPDRENPPFLEKGPANYGCVSNVLWL